MKKIKMKKIIIQIILVLFTLFSLNTYVFAIGENPDSLTSNTIEGNPGGDSTVNSGGTSSIQNPNYNDGNMSQNLDNNFLDQSVSSDDNLDSGNEMNNQNTDNSDIGTPDIQEEYTNTTVESITPGVSDESLSITNLLLIVSISLNIVLLILAIVVILKMNKKM